jgi:hypothetical protein
MAIRTLRRRVIIREYDFKKVRDQAFAPLAFMGSLETLYDRAEFTPLNQENLEKLKLIEVLKGKTNILTEVPTDLQHPRLLVYQLRDYMYDDRYHKWQATTDEEGYLCVQARKNTPKSRLGWGVFEKDIESRI